MKHLWGILGSIVIGLLTAVSPAIAIQCSFVSTVGVNFGPYAVFNTIPNDSTGSITFICLSVGPGGAITIDVSKGNASTYLSRQMRQGAYTLDYNLYQDAARTSIWGDGTGGSSHYGPVIPPSNTNVTITIYSRIPARQNARVGSYADTITATINF
jgi:spore coat protein U-like protein